MRYLFISFIIFFCNTISGQQVSDINITPLLSQLFAKGKTQEAVSIPIPGQYLRCTVTRKKAIPNGQQLSLKLVDYKGELYLKQLIKNRDTTYSSKLNSLETADGLVLKKQNGHYHFVIDDRFKRKTAKKK